MVQPIKQHQQYNQSVFQSTTSRSNDNQQSGSHSASNKMSHHTQDMHGYYNQQVNYGGHQPFNSNGAGSSNNFYQPYNNNMGHYSVSFLSNVVNIENKTFFYQQQAPQQQQQQPNWNQQQQYFR